MSKTTSPDLLRPCVTATAHHAGMSPGVAKSIGLEAILWLSQVRLKHSARLLGIHARAARLPPDWWLSRAHWPIEAIITAVEQELPESLTRTVLTSFHVEPK